MPRGKYHESGRPGGPKMQGHMDQGYSTREAARLCDLTLRQVRTLAHSGVVGSRAKPAAAARPKGRRLRLTFGELQVLRTVRRLLAAGLALGEVARSMGALRRQLARRRLPLSAACCEAAGGRVVAYDGERRWDVLSGAEAGAAPQRAEAPLVPLPAPAKAPRLGRIRGAFGDEGPWGEAYAYEQADTWFGRGLRAERDNPRRACGHYLRAIACNPEHVEAMINVGHVCAAEGDRRRAAAFFRLAARVDPEHAVAHYNLAVMLHDAGERGAAMQAYRRALLLDPGFADAHYNLGTLLAEQGHSAEAGTHFTAFHAASQPLPPPG